ncbi:uncharacterized protein LOC105422587 [Pogonomyrmex barbatus]|uniref:Uncharacterized protein LOC105422587 n=1 Tax=Pogonomyrmex barbatus TaxID=144034 RepID=A0A6I9VU90_9HYME|nr:uncharacterized protein LOC105422587 [Pogonomyrmex barbatus]
MTCILNRLKTSALCRSIFHKNIVFDPVIKISHLKIHSEHVTNKINAWAEKKYKQKDNINSNYQLVYREQTTISRTIILTYHFGWKNDLYYDTYMSSTYSTERSIESKPGSIKLS